MVALHGLSHAWIVILAALILAYAVFVGTALLTGLDEDDRTVARAAWQRFRIAALPSTTDRMSL